MLNSEIKNIKEGTKDKWIINLTKDQGQHKIIILQEVAFNRLLHWLGNNKILKWDGVLIITHKFKIITIKDNFSKWLITTKMQMGQMDLGLHKC